ncbi:hypothetical protein MHTCC0001_26890 [Flavobacteriaceae bacterium MHTCC 0001]
MKAKLHYVFSISIFLVVFSVYGQQPSWKVVKTIKNAKTLSNLNLNSRHVTFVAVDTKSFQQKLAQSTNHFKKGTLNTISIPVKNGDLQQFEIEEHSVFSPSLAAKFPDIKSYKGYATDGSGAKLVMSVSPEGMQTMISYPDKPDVFMHPVQRGGDSYVVYNRSSKFGDKSRFKCHTLTETSHKAKSTQQKRLDEGGANTQTLQKFRIAISVTGEYTDYFGGTVAGALAAINATMTRVNGVFEADMAVTFELVDATELIYTNANTDPYSDFDVGTREENLFNSQGWSFQLQNTLTSTIGSAAYDIGHLFGHNAGTGVTGFAGCIGCVCIDGTKGSAFSTPPNSIPEGDTFDVDFVLHEIGHQMGANHTWAFEPEGTGVQVEPGSGSTIMGYAGTQGEDNVAPKSDPYFHHMSIKQILENLSFKSCQATETLTNNAPNADAGSSYTIPSGTPYMLKGNATDADTDDELTYCWEQIDDGIVNSGNFGPGLSNGAMNRSLPPSTSPDRYIPRLSSVLKGRVTQTNPGLGSDWETASNLSRTLNWALTVRDRNPDSNSVGQSSYDTMQVQVESGSTSNPVGPFRVTSQTAPSQSWTQNSIQTVTWDVAGTNANGINTSNVDILLSINGGETFGTVLVSNTPNDGSETFVVPDITASRCRIMVRPVDNIYYAVNPVDFAVGFRPITTCEQRHISGSNLNLSILDGQSFTTSINVPSGSFISSMKVNVDITHSFISDLTITLENPDGTSSCNLWSENCFIDTGYENLNIIFDDAATSVSCNSPTVGTYIPSTPLDVFTGQGSIGEWKLTITDSEDGDQGVLNNWYVEFCTTVFQLLADTFEGFLVYPNPNNGLFNIKLNTSNADRMLHLEVYDMRGRFVYAEDFSGSTSILKTVDLRPLKSGVYFMNLFDVDQKYTHKILIR